MMYFYSSDHDNTVLIFVIRTSKVQGRIIMAFCNKFGNVLRQGAARSSQAPVSSMLNYIRSMSSSKLFIGGIVICLGRYLWIQTTCVGANFLIVFIVLDFAIVGLSYGVDDQSLKDAFSSYGDVVEGEFNLLSLLLYGSISVSC